MIQQTSQADEFKQKLRDSLQRQTLNSRAIGIPRHVNVYDYLAQIARASGRVCARRNNSFQNHPIIRQKSIPKSAEPSSRDRIV
jgi:hypothetical protein